MHFTAGGAHQNDWLLFALKLFDCRNHNMLQAPFGKFLFKFDALKIKCINK